MKAIYTFLLITFTVAGLAGKLDFRNGLPEGAVSGKISRLVDDPVYGKVLLCEPKVKTDSGGLILPRNSGILQIPDTAFKLRIVFKALPNEAGHTLQVLVDSKYVFMPPPDNKKRHRGYAVLLQGGPVNYTPVVYLGQGESSHMVTGKPVKLDDGRYHELEMEYHGTGKVRLLIDGQVNGEGEVAMGTVKKPGFPTVIGERNGSGRRYSFSGFIAEVELSSLKVPELSVSQFGRRVFYRLEEKAELQFMLTNITGETMNNVKVNGIDFGNIGPLKKLIVRLPELETRLRPGDYKLPLKIDTEVKERKLQFESEGNYSLVVEPRTVFPVMMRRGVGEFLPEYGFTHLLVDLRRLLTRNGEKAEPENIELAINRVDSWARFNLQSIDNFVLPHDLPKNGKYLRIGKDGKPYAHRNLDAANPEVQRIFANATAETAKALAEHPFFAASLIGNELRGGSKPSYSGFEQQNFKQFSGYEIPKGINDDRNINYASLPGFSAMRIVSDNDKYLTYFRWWYSEGDGWPGLMTIVHREFHQYIKRPFVTIYDPATRVPPLWGSGGEADMLGQWTYPYPDPVKMSQVTAELRAMAANTPGRKIMPMIQCMMYRRQTAPLEKQVDNPPDWMNHEAKAPYLTLSPDLFREALWSALAHQIDAMTYHGFGSMFPQENNTHSYRYTHPGLKEELKRQSETVLRPLGPTLLQLLEIKPDMVILQSFASQIFARRGTNGWGNGWIADIYLALQWAHYQPGIIFEEELVRDRLNGVKVLVMPGCEVLPQRVFDVVRKFQERGGIIIADEYIVPEIMPDIVVHSYNRTRNNGKDKKVLQELGTTIKQQLNEFYESPFTAANQDIVLRMRRYDNADYLFVINDKRTYGDYIGQWGIVMEKGLPNSGMIDVKTAARFAYDLVEHRQIPANAKSGVLSMKTDFKSNDGTLLMLLNQQIAKLSLTLPPQAKRGEEYSVKLKILDMDNQPVKALLPVKITISDNLAGSGYFCAVDGSLEYIVVPSLNDESNEINIQAQCLSSGQTASDKILLVH